MFNALELFSTPLRLAFYKITQRQIQKTVKKRTEGRKKKTKNECPGWWLLNSSRPVKRGLGLGGDMDCRCGWRGQWDCWLDWWGHGDWLLGWWGHGDGLQGCAGQRIYVFWGLVISTRAVQVRILHALRRFTWCLVGTNELATISSISTLSHLNFATP